MSSLRERLESAEAPDAAGASARAWDAVADAYAACEGAHVLAVLTEWDEFKWIDLDKVADLMAHPRVMDARNLLDRAALARRGFTYEGIGRR